jgi:IS5 family transposase
MRKRFEQQIVIGRRLIQDTEIPTAKRSGPLPGLCASLKEIFVSNEWNEKVFEVLENKVFSSNNKTGRPGMDLWQIFVLSQVRLCLNISYDKLHDLANHHTLVRQIMGVETEFSFQKQNIGYQRIIDNVSLLDDETVKQLNDIIIAFGHGVFKKKEEELLRLKTDSFVVESNVHFPTDYNLLWDCARKCLDTINKLQRKNKDLLIGWRKLNDWRRELKNLSRAVGKASSSVGKGKNERVTKAVQKYLTKANLLATKITNDKPNFPQQDIVDTLLVTELFRFKDLLEKHINLLERRVIKGEVIPHEEKMFSIFEDYTEWITKGKMRPNIELGKKVNITTDQFNLIIDFQVMEKISDSQIVKDIVSRITPKHKIGSWSFDKGYWHSENKNLLLDKVKTVVMPKKGKRNKLEAEEERKPLFKKLKNKHSAVESNINELENRGLNRCPDKGFANFKRYVGLAICSYNLKKIGEKLLEEARKKEILSRAKAAA